MPTLAELDTQIADLEGQIATAQQGGGEAGPDYSAFFQSPGYQFRQDEGIRAIDRSASARGQLMSGGTLRELQRYGQGLASSEFGNYANRLASLAGIGQTANQQGSQAGASAGGQVGQSMANIGQSVMAGGTAQAAGIVDSSNAMTRGISGAAGSLVNSTNNWMGSGGAMQQFGAQQGWWGGFDPSTGINWATGRQF